MKLSQLHKSNGDFDKPVTSAVSKSSRKVVKAMNANSEEIIEGFTSVGYITNGLVERLESCPALVPAPIPPPPVQNQEKEEDFFEEHFLRLELRVESQTTIIQSLQAQV